MDYNREHGTEVRIVRIFNTYGPRMALDDGRVVSNFVSQVRTLAPCRQVAATGPRWHAGRHADRARQPRPAPPFQAGSPPVCLPGWPAPW